MAASLPSIYNAKTQNSLRALHSLIPSCASVCVHLLHYPFAGSD